MHSVLTSVIEYILLSIYTKSYLHSRVYIFIPHLNCDSFSGFTHSQLVSERDYSIRKFNCWSSLSITINWLFLKFSKNYISFLDWISDPILKSHHNSSYTQFRSSCHLLLQKWIIRHCLIWLTRLVQVRRFRLYSQKTTKFGHFIWRTTFKDWKTDTWSGSQ